MPAAPSSTSAKAGKPPRIAASGATDGTQAIERAIVVLRELATRGRLGWGLTDLAAACGLKKATVHRILVRLEHERLVHQRPADAHYFIGPMIAELGLAIPGHHIFMRAAQEFVADLGRREGLVAILSIRSGDQFVVAARAASARFKGELNEVGARRPLITTAGGIAILLALERTVAARIARSNLEQLAQRGRTSVAEYRAMWTRSRRAGYACNLGDIAPGINAVAVAARGVAAQPFASLTLAGGAAHLPPERFDDAVSILRRECVQLAHLAAQVHPGLYAAPAA